MASENVDEKSAACHEASAAVFVCKELHHSYLDRFTSLAGVSFSVRPGERLALLGANGSGKSTLLKALAGLIFPTAGTIWAFGQELTRDVLEDEQFSTAFRSRVGIVFQNSDAQLFSATVRDEIAFGCLQVGLSREETAARVRDVVDMLEISDLLERAPFQLSGGQKKRVAIASVLAMNPEVLLFDEPTTALDPRTKYWLAELIECLAAAGKTIVTATHDLELLDRVADRCIVIGESHEIVGAGTPPEVFADAGLLLEANLVHVHAHRHGTGQRHTHRHPAGHHHDDRETGARPVQHEVACESELDATH